MLACHRCELEKPDVNQVTFVPDCKGFKGSSGSIRMMLCGDCASYMREKINVGLGKKGSALRV